MHTRSITLFLLCSVFQSILAQQIIYYNQDWKKCSKSKASYYRKIIGRDSLGNTKVEDYYIKGTLQMTGSYASLDPDIKNGIFIFYREDGSPKNQFTYIKDTIEGASVEWNSKGQIASKGNYKANKLDGVWLYYDSLSGQLNREDNFVSDKRHGSFKTYYLNGQLSSLRQFENNKEVSHICYTEQGKDTACCGNYFQGPTFQGKSWSKFSSYFRENFAPTNWKVKPGNYEINIIGSIEGKMSVSSISPPMKPKFAQEIKDFIENSKGFVPASFDCKPVNARITMPLTLNKP